LFTDLNYSSKNVLKLIGKFEMKRIWHLLFYPCRKATELIDRRTIEPLSKSEDIRLAIHLSMCEKCSGYVKHSEFVDVAIEKMVNENLQYKEKILSEFEVGELIKKILLEIEK